MLVHPGAGTLERCWRSSRGARLRNRFKLMALAMLRHVAYAGKELISACLRMQHACCTGGRLRPKCLQKGCGLPCEPLGRLRSRCWCDFKAKLPVLDLL